LRSGRTAEVPLARNHPVTGASVVKAKAHCAGPPRGWEGSVNEGIAAGAIVAVFVAVLVA
jgi:hypothetical protein